MNAVCSFDKMVMWKNVTMVQVVYDMPITHLHHHNYVLIICINRNFKAKLIYSDSKNPFNVCLEHSVSSAT